MAKIKFSYSRSGMSADYCGFFQREAKKIAKILESKGCTNVQITSGFYYFSGFYTDPNGQVWYFNSGDVRNWDDTYGYQNDRIYYRTAQHYKDYTGGVNRWMNVADFENWPV